MLVKDEHILHIFDSSLLDGDVIHNETETTLSAMTTAKKAWPHPFLIKDSMVFNDVLNLLNTKQGLEKSSKSQLLAALFNESDKYVENQYVPKVINFYLWVCKMCGKVLMVQEGYMFC